MPDKRLKYMNNIDNKQFNTKEQLNNTVLNESILNWYEFSKDKELLQLGADNKYLVELFARRCEKVTVAVSKEEEKDRGVALTGGEQVAKQIAHRVNLLSWDAVPYAVG